MAVYTEVDADTAAALLRTLDAGTLTSMRGCAGGIENTNYFVHSDKGDWVLTVFERLGFDQLPFYLGLMQHLARKGLPVPEPRTDASGNFLHSIAGKPASLVNLLPGRSIDAPMLAHCSLLGVTLAHLHTAAVDYPLQQPNLRGLEWWEKTVPIVQAHVGPELARRLAEELDFQQRFHAAASTQSLPRGPVHADLFRDNALFDGPPESPRLSGVFDFYFAGVDHHVFDLAVCVNDWCIDLATGRLEPEHAQALLRAYHVHRPMSPAELRALPGMRRAAALRFWLSRLADWYLPREAALLKAKDPTHFERVLRDCTDHAWHASL
ncbi:MAG TPA: homoserine kinase [Burkholderiaceae bacterium]|nr:homoserine kinase [Burkholderiaceae bacterium]